MGGKPELFALPLHPNPAVLFFNKDLFAQRGVKAPDATWTWDTLLDSARRLTGPEEPAVEAPYEPIALWMTVRSMGGDILDPEWKKYTLDQPGGVAVIEWIADLALRHRVAVTRKPGQPPAPSRRGKVALKWDIFPTIESDPPWPPRGSSAFDVAPVPRGSRGRVNRNVIGAYALLLGAPKKAPGAGTGSSSSPPRKRTSIWPIWGGMVPALKEAAQPGVPQSAPVHAAGQPQGLPRRPGAGRPWCKTPTPPPSARSRAW